MFLKLFKLISRKVEAEGGSKRGFESAESGSSETIVKKLRPDTVLEDLK